MCKKTHLTYFIIGSLFIGLSACKQQSNGNLPKPDLNNKTDRVSYSIGYDIGQNFKRQDADINPAVLARGVADALSGAKDTSLSQSDMQKAIQQFQSDLYSKHMQKQTALSKKNEKEEEDFLAKNAKKDSVHVTDSGLQYKILKKGTGPKPTANDEVTVNYTGMLPDGTVFDSSQKHGGPANLNVGHVIQGWTEALQMMHVGGKWRLFIPSKLAYGSRGAGSTIGPNQLLIFDVELIKIDQPKNQKSNK
jgi:FKBP-type peptidyl-prolyl cis-trans isomerase FklB